MYTYTQVPNFFLEEQAKTLGEAELRVYLCIIRKTLGFHKDKDFLSYSQIQQMSGLTAKSIRRGLKGLAEKGLIHRSNPRYHQTQLVTLPPDFFLPEALTNFNAELAIEE